MKKSVLLIVILLMVAPVLSLEVVWNLSYGNGQSTIGAGIEVDSNENIYVTGYSSNSSRTPNQNLIEIRKYDSDGNLLWNVSEFPGSPGTPNAPAWTQEVLADEDNQSVYVCGSVWYSSNSRRHLWVGKRDISTGAEIWDQHRTIGDGNSQAYDCVLLSANQGILAAGSYFNGNVGGERQDFWVVKYDSNGNYDWQVIWSNGTSDEGLRGIALGPDEDTFYVAGGGESALGPTQMITSKYNMSTRALIWLRTFIWGNPNVAYDLAVDSEGNAYVVGESRVGGYDQGVIIKYDTNGNQLWNVSYNVSEFHGINLDSTENYIYVTGRMSNWVNWDQIVMKLDSSGDQIFNITYDSGGNEIAYDVEEGSLFVTGAANNNMTILGYGENPAVGYVNVSITTTLAIEVIQEDVDFGEGAVSPGQPNATLYTNQDNPATQVNGNWTLPNAYALEVMNTGNINCSLGISSSKTANSFLGGTNPEYQWKVSDKEAGSCSGGLTHGVWSDVNSSATACGHFSPINATDEIFIDFRLVVPYDANPTDSLVHKTDIITIVASATA
jgi:hypothetical protein